MQNFDGLIIMCQVFERYPLSYDFTVKDRALVCDRITQLKRAEWDADKVNYNPDINQMLEGLKCKI